MGVYRKITCPKCSKNAETRSDKVKELVCKRCNCVVKVNAESADYYIDYIYKGKRCRENAGPNRNVAEAALAKRRTEIAENKFLDVKRVVKVRFEDFSDQYLDGHCKVNHKAYEKASASQLRMLKKYFSGKCLDEITSKSIEQYKYHRLSVDKVTPATVNRCLARLKAMYNTAIKWKIYEGTNPVKDVRLLKEDNHHLRYLQKHEIEKLIAVSNDKIKAIIIVAVNTGMRRAEILNLKWRDVNFHDNNICLLETKSGQKRIIPMNTTVRDALIAVRKHPKSEYIFYKDDGQPLKDIRSIFDVSLTRAGIVDFRFHDLRHTFASQLVMSGVDLNTVRELLGHSDLKTTLIYAHLSQDHKKRAVNVLCQQVTKALPQKQELIIEPIEQEFAIV